MASLHEKSSADARLGRTDAALPPILNIPERPAETVAEKTPKFAGNIQSKSEKEETASDSVERQVRPVTAPNGPARDEDVLSADRYPGDGTMENPFIVDWDRDDSENPYNWSTRSRWLLTCQVCG